MFMKSKHMLEACANKLLGTQQLLGPQVANYILHGLTADRMTNAEFCVLYYANAVPYGGRKRLHEVESMSDDSCSESDDDMNELNEESADGQHILGSNLHLI